MEQQNNSGQSPGGELAAQAGASASGLGEVAALDRRSRSSRIGRLAVLLGVAALALLLSRNALRFLAAGHNRQDELTAPATPVETASSDDENAAGSASQAAPPLEGEAPPQEVTESGFQGDVKEESNAEEVKDESQEELETNAEDSPMPSDDGDLAAFFSPTFYDFPQISDPHVRDKLEAMVTALYGFRVPHRGKKRRHIDFTFQGIRFRITVKESKKLKFFPRGDAVTECAEKLEAAFLEALQTVEQAKPRSSAVLIDKEVTKTEDSLTGRLKLQVKATFKDPSQPADNTPSDNEGPPLTEAPVEEEAFPAAEDQEPVTEQFPPTSVPEEPAPVVEEAAETDPEAVLEQPFIPAPEAPAAEDASPAVSDHETATEEAQTPAEEYHPAQAQQPEGTQEPGSLGTAGGEETIPAEETATSPTQNADQPADGSEDLTGSHSVGVQVSGTDETSPAAEGEEAGPQPPAAAGEEAGPQPPAAEGEKAGPQPPTAEGEEAGPQPPAAEGEEAGPQPPAPSADGSKGAAAGNGTGTSPEEDPDALGLVPDETVFYSFPRILDRAAKRVLSCLLADMVKMGRWMRLPPKASYGITVDGISVLLVVEMTIRHFKWPTENEAGALGPQLEATILDVVEKAKNDEHSFVTEARIQVDKKLTYGHIAGRSTITVYASRGTSLADKTSTALHVDASKLPEATH